MHQIKRFAAWVLSLFPKRCRWVMQAPGDGGERYQWVTRARYTRGELAGRFASVPVRPAYPEEK